jgi:hypothetical protein
MQLEGSQNPNTGLYAQPDEPSPTWSIGHPWNASFHFSFLILDSR